MSSIYNYYSSSFRLRFPGNSKIWKESTPHRQPLFKYPFCWGFVCFRKYSVNKDNHLSSLILTFPYFHRKRVPWNIKESHPTVLISKSHVDSEVHIESIVLICSENRKTGETSWRQHRSTPRNATNPTWLLYIFRIHLFNSIYLTCSNIAKVLFNLFAFTST